MWNIIAVTFSSEKKKSTLQQQKLDTYSKEKGKSCERKLKDKRANIKA